MNNYVTQFFCRVPSMDLYGPDFSDSKDPVFFDSRDPLIIFSDSRDLIFNSMDPKRIPKTP